ncbi:hypothetical protein Golob_012426 [Gossypium lobatum]|uniref:Uncharacterized protein n=1 Tax=Gossypium lobatum TaxID=34289 RepID=A0A7J8LLA1_9ROSI|nr:hypothetical protein [Gossypium lobatum]
METQNSDNGTDREIFTLMVIGILKKVRFKEAVDREVTNMVVDFDQQSIMSFKDKLLRGGVAFSGENLEGSFEKIKSDFELMEGDVNMSMVNGITAIAFSDRIKDILFKEMELTVILKLLGRNISYNGAAFDDFWPSAIAACNTPYPYPTSE